MRSGHTSIILRHVCATVRHISQIRHAADVAESAVSVNTGASGTTNGARPALGEVAPLSGQRAGSVDCLRHAGARMPKPWDRSLPPLRACAKQRGTWWARFVSGESLLPNSFPLRFSQFLLVVH